MSNKEMYIQNRINRFFKSDAFLLLLAIYSIPATIGGCALFPVTEGKEVLAILSFILLGSGVFICGMFCGMGIEENRRNVK